MGKNSHKSLRRILHRCNEELKATKEISKVTSLGEGITTFLAKVDIQIMNHNGYKENKLFKKHLLKKHEIMLKYYEKTFDDFLEKYDFDYNLNQMGKESKYKDCIWVCWWQGLENAPEIVKICVDSIKKCAGNHEVIILTEDNYKDYVDIPEWVEEKRKAGIITRTNYSDLLRLSLLAKHGGMWLDSTFFCNNIDLDEYFKLPIWSIKRPDYAHNSVACGYFAGYSLYCSQDNRWIFATIRDFFLNYWKKNDFMIDYLMVDYMIELSKRKDFRIQKEFDKIPANNKNCDELYKVLSQVYDKKAWDRIKKDTGLFKLSWKQNYALVENGKDTFYSMVINNRL